MSSDSEDFEQESIDPFASDFSSQDESDPEDFVNEDNRNGLETQIFHFCADVSNFSFIILSENLNVLSLKIKKKK